MTDNEYTKGTCEEMCPVSEINLRMRNKLVHYYEPQKLIAEFQRSSADHRKRLASDLRTFGALHKTLEYLFNM